VVGGPADRRVTVADIAAEAGVSVATVSKVLNGRPDVAAPTRARIEAILVGREYVRVPRRRGVAARGGLIEMLFNDAGSPWAAEMIRGGEAAARAAGMGLVVSVLGGGRDRVRQWVAGVGGRGVRGVVLALPDFAPADQARLRRLDLPAVLVDPVGDFDAEVPSIGAGNWGGGLAGTRHLVELGHRRIGVITGPMWYLCSQARLAGYRAALERAGLPYDHGLVVHGSFHHASGLAAALELLARPDPPTAVVAANDEQAAGVYAAARQRGLRIPDDLSVVGFDDVPMAQWIHPALTTVRQPIGELAALAVRGLLARLAGGEAQPGRIELPTTLVVRDSTAAPPVGLRSFPKVTETPGS
jgi:LacI family transcriptional regulator